jgi:23S rRNA pseudouridine1911/1915/1917 synthase
MSFRTQSVPWAGGEVPIIHEDEDIIVCNKPSGLLTVPIPKSAAENLYTILREYVTGRGKIALTVHRIDRYTTGLVVFAKHKTARHSLVQQFLKHTPTRVYHCLVRGTVKKTEGELIHRLKQVETSFKNVIAAEDDEEGSNARLTYKVLEQYPKAALVEVKLDTGFKNQIRAQFSILGNPLVGDVQYGKKREASVLNRQALHAYQLTFVHPRMQKPITFQAPYPQDFADALQLLKIGLAPDGGVDENGDDINAAAAVARAQLAETQPAKPRKKRY